MMGTMVVDQRRGEVHPSERDHHLDELREAAGYRDRAEAMIVSAALGARANGATWLEIANALGISHQGARKRFMDLARRADEAAKVP
jgi:hypothetical protein